MNNVALLNEGQFRNAHPAHADVVEHLAERISSRRRASTTSSNGLGLTRDEVQSFAVRHQTEASMDSNLQMDVRRARKLRRLRKRIFGKHMFSGPGWDILLHLFETHLAQLRDTVGNVCIGTELPGATAVRWIGRLEQEQLVSLRDDQFDGRRRFVELTNAGVQLMSNYFAGAAPHQITA
jgi:DNA-binding MarR family transcriptional regulator